jgi:hypothetical protein
MTEALSLTVFAKSDGPLTKRISLAENGSLKSDGSACIMARGTARRFEFSGVEPLAALIEQLSSHEALALGTLRLDLLDCVDVVTKRKLNGALRPDIIARTTDYLAYGAGLPALVLVDYDNKAMPHGVRARIDELGGLWPALVYALPALSGVAHVTRSSTSAGLYRTDTGAELPGSSGLHVFVLVQNGMDSERFLKTLHLRCWLAGLGWMMVGAGGQLLERSIVDRVVGSPERLVFEGPPILDPPLAQHKESRRAVATPGEALDTVAACPSLTIPEQAKFRELRAKEAVRLGEDARKARNEFVAHQAQRFTDRAGLAQDQARRVIERQCDGILLPDIVLPFDDEELVGATVADVLADPGRFEDATLADPIEGPQYGAGKAKIMRRADGTLWINSFAHGRTIYELQRDYRSAEAALNKASADEVADVFVRCVLGGDLGEDEIDRLRNLASKIGCIGKRALDALLKRARRERTARRHQEEREWRLAQRRDPRPQVPLPAVDEEWLPQMRVLNDVLGGCRDAEPPARNANKLAAQVRARRIPSLHLLSTRESNRDD